MNFNEIEDAFAALEASLRYDAWEKREASVRHLRDKGWNDLADVIADQEGRVWVRQGMQDIIEWCGYRGRL